MTEVGVMGGKGHKPRRAGTPEAGRGKPMDSPLKPPQESALPTPFLNFEADFRFPASRVV